MATQAYYLVKYLATFCYILLAKLPWNEWQFIFENQHHSLHSLAELFFGTLTFHSATLMSLTSRYLCSYAFLKLKDMAYVTRCYQMLPDITRCYQM